MTMWTTVRYWATVITDRWTHRAPRCGWCDDILPVACETTHDEEFGAVCALHVDTGELPRQHDEDSDPDATRDRLTDAWAGV